MNQITERSYYHVYNRGINGGRLFFQKSDYTRVIEKYFFYTYMYLETWAWCLLPNHFHVLIRIRPTDEQRKLFAQLKSMGKNDGFYGLKYSTFKPKTPSSLLAHWMNSHTRFINQKNKRTGPLFDGRFRRIEISSQRYLRYLVCYIHRNPIHHGLVKSFNSYPFSSYKELITDSPSYLCREEVMNSFGGRENFIAAHQEVKNELEQIHLE